jgi:hypothetical protein
MMINEATCHESFADTTIMTPQTQPHKKRHPAQAKMLLTAPVSTPVSSPAPSSLKMEDPPYRGLDSNLYMQISAEYRACCLQAYSWAKRIVHEKIASQASQVSSADSEKPLAVILDLDETVLDNRAFQTKQIQEGWAYNQDLWAIFEKEGGKDVISVLSMCSRSTSPIETPEPMLRL